MLIEHFLCDDVGGKHNVCGMEIVYYYTKKSNIEYWISNELWCKYYWCCL